MTTLMAVALETDTVMVVAARGVTIPPPTEAAVVKLGAATGATVPYWLAKVGSRFWTANACAADRSMLSLSDVLSGKSDQGQAPA